MKIPGFVAVASLCEVAMVAVTSDFSIFPECPEKLGCVLIEQFGWICKYLCQTVEYGGEIV